ncbi:MAG: SurA N-terminal domain-containing protein [Alphaproteobacteria bacterium]
MLDLLRKNATGPLGIALIILLVFAFSIWGVGDIFRGYNANILAKIGNRELNAQNYLFNFNREVNRISNQLERIVTTEEAINSGLHYQILDRSLVELSANAASDEIGLIASDDAIKKRILSTNAFKNAFNQFDRNIFEQIIRQNGLTEDSFLVLERDSHVLSQLSKSVFKDINPPSALNDLLFRYQFERRNVDYIIISPDEISQEDEVDKNEIEIFYNENINLYKTEETRDFSVISLNVSTLSKLENVSDEEINIFYEDNKYNYYEPEKRSYYLIPYFSNEDAIKALENYSFNGDIEKILIDRNLNINDVDQGLITFDDGISESVSETAFNASLNQLSGPTESPFGPSLIYVNEIISEKEIKIEEIKDQIIIDIQKDKAKDKVYSLYGEIEDLRAEGKTLEEIAEEKSLSIESFKNINDVGQRIDGSIIKNPSLEELINLIFLNDVDEDLEPYEDSEDNLNFFRIDNINYSQQIPLNEAMENIKLSILENKSIENVKTKSKEIFDRLKEYNNNLDFISDENDLAIAKSGILGRTSSNEIFTSKALSEIFKTEKGSSFIVNAAIGNSIVIGKVSNIDLLEKTEERMEAINDINKSRLENDLIVSLAEEHQKELSSEIFLDRLNLLFENQEAEGSF